MGRQILGTDQKQSKHPLSDSDDYEREIFAELLRKTVDNVKSKKNEKPGTEINEY